MHTFHLKYNSRRNFCCISRYLLTFLGVLFVFGFYREMRLRYKEKKYQVGTEILDLQDLRLKGPEDGSIHIMQFLLGAKSVRYHVTFMKSLLWHYRKSQTPHRPLHLHLLTDKATRIILENLFLTWNLPRLQFSFYPSEVYQKKIGWMKSTHPATKVATMKMYISEMLNSTVHKLLLIDSDTLLMNDITEMWNLFDQFKKHQIFGMAREELLPQFNSQKIGGIPTKYGYNAGIMLWNLQNLPVSKWEAIWKPTFDRANLLKYKFEAAEQTLLNIIAFEIPDIFFEIPCVWNVQLFEWSCPKMCQTTWNSIDNNNSTPPKIMHIDRFKKNEDVFNLDPLPTPLTSNEEMTHNFLVERSKIIQIDGYSFQDDTKLLDVREILLRIHPEDGKINKNLMKHDWPYPGAFQLHHRVHPAYFFADKKGLAGTKEGVTLVLGLDYDGLIKTALMSYSWPGHQSVVVHASDLEAHMLFGFIFKSEKILSNSEMAIHIIYKREKVKLSPSMKHNIAVVFAPTEYIFKATGSNPNQITKLFGVVSTGYRLAMENNEMNLYLDRNYLGKSTEDLLRGRCSEAVHEFCVLSIEHGAHVYFNASWSEAIVGILMPRAYALLPETNTSQSESDVLKTFISNFNNFDYKF